MRIAPFIILVMVTNLSGLGLQPKRWAQRSGVHWQGAFSTKGEGCRRPSTMGALEGGGQSSDSHRSGCSTGEERLRLLRAEPRGSFSHQSRHA